MSFFSPSACVSDMLHQSGSIAASFVPRWMSLKAWSIVTSQGPRLAASRMAPSSQSGAMAAISAPLGGMQVGSSVLLTHAQSVLRALCALCLLFGRSLQTTRPAGMPQSTAPSANQGHTKRRACESSFGKKQLCALAADGGLMLMLHGRRHGGVACQLHVRDPGR